MDDMKLLQDFHEDDVDIASGLQTFNNNLPEHWRIVKLENVLREVDIRAEELKVIESEQMPVLSLTKNKGLILQSERFNNRVATQDISNYKVIKEGQIVYNPFVLWEGAIYALKGREQGLVSPVYLVWEATDANNYFLDFLLRTPQLLNEYLRVASGVVQRRRAVRKGTFLNIRIPLPPPPEQQSIVQVLQTVHEAIQVRRDELVLENARKNALMEHFFKHGIRNEQSRTSEIGEIPVNWSVKYLENFLLETQYGLSLPLGLSGKYPVLRMNNLQDGFISFKDIKYVDLENATFQKFKLNKGDLLFNRTNSYELVGKTSLFDSDEAVVFASYLIT
jgi:type I restriction enzyme S subunit